jgi:hypothetical protein
MTPEELKTRFTYHAPKPGQLKAYQDILDKAYELVQLFDQHCPESWELVQAHTNVEQSVMWAHAAIVRPGPQIRGSESPLSEFGPDDMPLG